MAGDSDVSETPLRPLVIRAVVIGIAMVLLDLPLRTAAVPLGVVQYEFAWTAETATEMIDSWADVRLFAWGSLLVDYAFMWAYASLIAGLAGRALAPSAARLAGSAAWAAAGFDAVENVGLIAMFARGATSGWALTAGVAASIKFALLAAAIVAILWGFATRRSRAA